MDQNSEFFQTSLKVAERFLQTAVVIDDRAFIRNEVREPIPHAIDAPPTPSTAAPLAGDSVPHSAVAPTDALIVTPDTDPHGINAETVIRSFAERGIVCSVLQRFQFQNPADVGTSGQKVLIPADILVIDWQVHRDDGSDSSEETLDFLTAAVDESTQYTPEQLRLIIVYTGALDLLEVADKIEKRLTKSGELPPQKYGNFAFQIGASRIVVLGKFSKFRSQENKEQQVEGDAYLAARATREFTAMTAGLISNVVLDGLASIRHVTHRILARFPPLLDAPFLAHRSLLSPPSDGNDHLLPLIASEIEAILEERWDPDLLSDETIGQWLKTRRDPKPMLDRIPNVTTEQAQQAVRDICLKGVYQHGDFSIPGQPGWVKKLAKDEKGGSDLEKLTELIGAEKAESANERLEELMSLKTRYGKKPPTLTLGTLVKLQPKTGDASYWLCLQPACDCFIRTDEDQRAFPFLSIKNSNQSFNLLAGHSGSYIRLKWEPRLHRIQMFEFQANSAVHAVVSVEAEGGFRFYAVDKSEFHWIGELKFPQAQRIANALAAASSRVGLTESEWLRRSAK
jgi:hypothetical protein